MAGAGVAIPLSVTSKLQEARLHLRWLLAALIEDDNWTGKTDAAERRRRQNRLHQRAWRRRKKLQGAPETQSPVGPAYQGDVKNAIERPLADGTVSLRQLVQDHVSGHQRLPISFDLPQSQFAFWAALETLGEPQSIFAYWAELRAQRKREITSALLLQHPSLALHLRTLQNHNSRNNEANCIASTQTLNQFLIGNIPRTQCTFELEFPLSVDHQLFVLIQHNALRGVMANMSILLRLNGRPLEGWADFYTEDLPTPPDDAPLSLQPTYLQKTVSHESWVDIIPCATMRDNILKNQDNLDTDALCDDFLGGMYEGLSEVESRGMILWGEPWSDGGWEISEGFARKWSFLLKGCGALVDSTNRWRAARGEEGLVVEV